MIGVSYTGHDGRRENFGVNGAEELAARMSGLAGRSVNESANDAQGLLREARRAALAKRPQPPAPAAREKVMPGGSVVRGMDGGLCLRGEENNPLVIGRKIYAAKDGGKGFFSFDEIDPPTHGKVVGKDVGDDTQSLDADKAEKALPDGVAWSMRVATDERAQKDENTGLVTVFKYFRKLYFSAAGRIVGCSGEWREVAYAFLAGGGTGNGKYGVRVFTTGDDENPAFNFLAFGTEANLDTWDEETQKFACNYDGTEPLANPPVKIAEVDICDCPVIEESAEV